MDFSLQGRTLDTGILRKGKKQTENINNAKAFAYITARLNWWKCQNEGSLQPCLETVHVNCCQCQNTCIQSTDYFQEVGSSFLRHADLCRMMVASVHALSIMSVCYHSVLPRLLLQGAAPCPLFVTPCPFEKAEMTPCPFDKKK